MSKILIIEDEHDLLEGLKKKLSKEGYVVFGTPDGMEGLDLARQQNPDVVLLDVMLPGIDGFEVCRRLREEGLNMPVIILSAKSEEIDRVVGLEIGADDYVTKPFSMRELLARIRARLREHRKTSESEEAHCQIGAVQIDFHRFEATRDGKALSLTSKEFEILKLLFRFRGQVVKRQQMLAEIWGYNPEATTRTVDSHILRLRQKVEKDPTNPRHIQTVYGSGYRLVVFPRLDENLA